MKVLGLDHVESFLAVCTDQQSRELLSAFVLDLKHHNWEDAEALLNHYPLAELDMLPKARFRLANNTILIEVIVHFDSGVLLLKWCRKARSLYPDSGDNTEWEAA